MTERAPDEQAALEIVDRLWWAREGWPVPQRIARAIAEIVSLVAEARAEERERWFGPNDSKPERTTDSAKAIRADGDGW
jgi:hypothetical protein